VRRVDAAAAREALHGGGEAALLDLREAGQFGEGHPLFAVPLPYSRLEAAIGALVPRLSAPVFLIDGGDGVAARGAARLAAMGYRDVAVIEGGVAAWEAAGFALYKGVNVPSKTLGELAEAAWHPEVVRAEELARWRADGRAFAFFDARPAQEHGKMRVPGARCLPNGELAHRLAAVADGERPIVITCAGRTRGLVGVIGLRVAGYHGPVYALENGTQGWALAGETLERGAAAEPYPPLGPEGLAAARARAEAVMARHAIAEVGAAEVAAMLGEAGRTTYVFDVRAAEEAAADRVAAAVHAPGGQLVQATDQWVGVRGARIVLCDDAGLRGALAAFWLRQLGFEAVVARIDDALRALPARPALPVPDTGLAERVAAAEALARIAGGGWRLLDLRGSMDYRRGHVAGAVWSVRPRLGALAAAGASVAIVAEEAEVADLAARDLIEQGAARVAWIEGGEAALAAAGAAIEATPGRPRDEEAIDHLFFVHDRHDGNLEASRRYLAWETGLVGQLDAVERAAFRVTGPG
jgi:rhodanese-related sulfurtransferase